jgi:hypothetical protein
LQSTHYQFVFSIEHGLQNVRQPLPFCRQCFTNNILERGIPRANDFPLIEPANEFRGNKAGDYITVSNLHSIDVEMRSNDAGPQTVTIYNRNMDRLCPVFHRKTDIDCPASIYDPAVPFNVLSTFAEFEGNLIRLRTREGGAIARVKGKQRVKQPKQSDKQQKELCRMHETGQYSISDLAELFSVSRPTVYRTLARRNGNKIYFP